MKDNASVPSQKTHLKDLALLFGVPVIIVLILAGFVYIPRTLANPGYDFIYCEGYSCDEMYGVDASGLIRIRLGTERHSYNSASLFYYDVSEDSTREIETTEALEFKVDDNSKSPDGYTLQHNTGGGGFLFWDSYQNNWSLSKGLASKPVNLDRGGYGDKKLMGWVLKNER